MALINISSKRDLAYDRHTNLCVFSIHAWKSWCQIAWMRYWFSQLHSQGDGNHSFLDCLVLKLNITLICSFIWMLWLASFVPVCHWIHAKMPKVITDSSGWALDRYSHHRANLFDCAEALAFNCCFFCIKDKEKSCLVDSNDAVVIYHLWHLNSWREMWSWDLISEIWIFAVKKTSW